MGSRIQCHAWLDSGYMFILQFTEPFPHSCWSRLMCSQQRGTTLDHGVPAVGYGTVSLNMVLSVSRSDLRHRCARSNVPYEAGPESGTEYLAGQCGYCRCSALQVDFLVRGPRKQATWRLFRRTTVFSLTPRILVPTASGWITPSRLATKEPLCAEVSYLSRCALCWTSGASP